MWANANPRTADPESDARTTDADRRTANGDTNTCADFNARADYYSRSLRRSAVHPEL